MTGTQHDGYYLVDGVIANQRGGNQAAGGVAGRREIACKRSCGRRVHAVEGEVVEVCDVWWMGIGRGGCTWWDT